MVTISHQIGEPISLLSIGSRNLNGNDMSLRYMRICGFAAEGLRSERMIHETFPSKELQDYWSTRPHYEDEAEASSSSSCSVTDSGLGGCEGQAYQDWLKTQKEDTDGPPPPPYSLEADEPEPEAVTQPARTESVLSSLPERTDSPVSIRPAVSQVRPQDAQVATAVVQGPSYATEGQPPTQGQLPITQGRSSTSQGPPSQSIVTPSDTLPTATSVFPTPAPPAVVHSVSAAALAENFIRQSSLSSAPTVSPSPLLSQPSQQQSLFPAVPVGLYGQSAQGAPQVRPSTSPIPSASGGYPRPGASSPPFGIMPTVQSPVTQPTSVYGLGPRPQVPSPRPDESGYFPNISQPQSSQTPVPGSSPTPPQQPQLHPQWPTQPQANQQYSYGPPPPSLPPRPVQPTQQYSYGPSVIPQVQWPHWNDSTQPDNRPRPSYSQSYAHSVGFTPPPRRNSPPFLVGQQSSQPPTPSFQVPLQPASIPPGKIHSTFNSH